MSDRKYSQRGYMSSDDERAPSGSRGPRRERSAGPRGRGLGKPTETVFRCAVCGDKQRMDIEVELDATCRKCGTDLHTCTHCRHFDTSAPGQCRARAPRFVAAKAKRNDCELFSDKRSQEFAEDMGGDSPSDAKAAFDALFNL